MNTVLKILIAIGVLAVLITIGGWAMHWIFKLWWLAFRLAVGAVVVLIVIITWQALKRT